MNATYPFISVIIPNYNHARYLDERIQSVLNQTFQDYELIILDDVSTDDSREVINKYRDNPKVSHIVFNEVNSGSTFKQWKKGMELARGQYIWIAESDDYCEPTLLSSLVEQVKSHDNCAFAYVLSQFVDQDGNYVAYRVKPHSDKYVKGIDYIQHYMCCECPVYNVSSSIFSKKVATEIAPSYTEYKACGDRLFWIEMAEKGDVAIINKPLNYFRQHLNKVTPQRAMDGTNLLENKRIFDYMMANNYLSNSFRKYLVMGYYLYLVQSSKFNNEDIRAKVLQEWNKGNKGSCIQRLLGRLFVSIRYHGLYLYL